jgi:hypothetical protein
VKLALPRQIQLSQRLANGTIARKLKAMVPMLFVRRLGHGAQGIEFCV